MELALISLRKKIFLLLLLHLKNLNMYLSFIKWKKLKIPSIHSPQRKKKKKLSRNQSSVFQKFFEEDMVYDSIGLFEDDFEELASAHRKILSRPRSSYTKTGKRYSKQMVRLDYRSRIFLLLYYLRNRPSFSALGNIFDVSKSFISRELEYLGPKLATFFLKSNIISFPSVPTQSPFELVVGAIDNTCHFRDRVHPKAGNWYRGDKGSHFMAAQVIVGLDGQIFKVSFGLGHNNDQGLFKILKTGALLEEKQIYLLADLGFFHQRLVKPNVFKSLEWNNTQKSLRSVVEVVIGLVKTFNFANFKCTISPETQQICLTICYYLVASRFKEFPLRASI